MGSVRLQAIQRPAPGTRTVFHSRVKKLFPFWQGKGDLDYLCSGCKAIIAKSIWERSISNIVVECPACGRYSEFRTIPLHEYFPSEKRVLINILDEVPIDNVLVIPSDACTVGAVPSSK